jgi:HAD superfamily hydrolase (TIGR01457 family)
VSSPSFDGLVCDLDGVVYSGDEAIAGAPEAINELRARGIRVVFCTNNSRSTVEQYIEKLGRLGIAAADDEVLTSAIVTAEELARRGDASAFVIGGDGVRKALEAAGIGIVAADGSADVVVVGLDPSFDYAKMTDASLLVAAGAALVATNDDTALPTPRGLLPGAGAILASIETATGVTAEVMGKPHRPMMDAAARRLEGCERIAVVGDRPETDLAGGAARGWITILVTTGVTRPEMATGVRPVPDVVISHLGGLLEARFPAD